VFFAIPLATMVKAVFTAWPRQAGMGRLVRQSDDALD